jgi:homoserine O-succinyltransferase
MIHLGLVNNMPDAALEATERQFRALLLEAAQGLPLRLSLYALPEVARSEGARQRIESSYARIGALWNSHLDGLIVTGAEPGAGSLSDQPYWASLLQLIDWTEDNTYSAVWSCLAAHAAVLRMDGIERRPLKSKLFGVFQCAKTAEDRLTSGLPERYGVPHSRWNDLPEDALSACGYRILSRSNEAGVDAFAKQRRSLFVFLQGHPEYDDGSLLLEYRRDLRRFHSGESTWRPGAFPAGVRCNWRPAAVQFYRNWLHYLFEKKKGIRAVGERFNCAVANGTF